MTGSRWPGSRARSGRGRSGRPSTAFDPDPSAGVRRRPPPAAAPRRSTGGDDDPVRVRDDRVEQLDLDPDDRVDAGRLRRGGEPDDAVEALVVGDGQAGQAKLDRSLDELVGGRRPVEKREVRVAVELGVGCHRDGR